MISCSKSEVRRCRPLLGTFVEITANGASNAATQAGVNAAFAVIEQMQKRFSVHDSTSELSQLNRVADQSAITVSAEMFKLLRRAQRLAKESKGAFDCAIAPTLACWGLRPAHLKRKRPGKWRDVQLLPGRKVRYLCPLALDLGGIAKGYAVDKAIEVLRKRGVNSAIVNAGGDLRAFGPRASTIHLRHPANPQNFAHTIHLKRGALATSSPCFTSRKRGKGTVSHLVDTRRGKAITGYVSVTVRARECWLADALTKVVLNAPRCAETLLAKYRAEAFMFTA